MNSLVLSNGSYEAFCEKEKKNIQESGAYLKASLLYGEIYENTSVGREVLFIATGCLDGSRMFALLRELERNKAYASNPGTILAGSERQKAILKEITSRRILVDDTEEAVKAVASAGVIVTEDYLPPYFVRKPKQRVLRMFTEDQKSRIEKDIKKKIQNTAALFQTTELILENAAHREYLETYFGAEYAVKDRLVVLPGEADNTEWILRGIYEGEFPEACTSIACRPCDSKKVLVALAWDSIVEENYAQTLAEMLLECGYEVYFVIQRVEKAELLFRLKSLNPKIKVIWQGWVFSCSEQDYIDLKYVISNFHSFEEPSKAVQKLLEKNLKREARRLFGETRFDAMFYVGKLNARLLAVTAQVQAERKVRIECKAPAAQQNGEKKALAYAETMKITHMVFERLVYPQVRFVEEAAHMGYDTGAIQVCPLRSTWQRLNESAALKEVRLGGEPYVVFSRNDLPYRNMELKLLPLPEENAYLANSDTEKIRELVERFSRTALAKEGAVLYVFGYGAENARDAAMSGQVGEQVKIINDVYLEHSGIFKEYVKLFRGYLTVRGNGEYCPIRAEAKLLQKKILEVQKDGSVSEAASVFAEDEQGVRESGRQTVRELMQLQ